MPDTRLEHWAQKLLDLSPANRLLNVPEKSRQFIQIDAGGLAELEDRLCAGKTFRLKVAPPEGAGASDFLAKGFVCAKSGGDTEKEIQRRLTAIYRQSKTDMEEGGVNTLFLAAGFLRWTDPKTKKSCRAPILLVPLALERASVADGVKISRRDEDTSANATLLELLRSVFGMVIPGAENPPADDSGIDVPAYLDLFAQAVAGREGWGVEKEAAIGCFSFAKFAMWNDMTARADALNAHPLVKHLVSGGGSFTDGIAPPASATGSLFCPAAADSSQLAAVAWSAAGKTFVLHGPPGTGKSQTITNIIAHNLAEGRRVLFVSEKKAALDVVKRRLDKAGLSPFCLELH